MRLKGSTKARPEELLIAEIIQAHLNLKVKTEYKIPDADLQPVGEMHLQGKFKPRPDIYFIIDGLKIIVRVNGPIHDEIKFERKDRLHRLYLQMQNPPWLVLDAWYYAMPVTFSSNRQKLSPEKLKQAYQEIQKNLFQLELPEQMDQEWAELYNSKDT